MLVVVLFSFFFPANPTSTSIKHKDALAAPEGLSARAEFVERFVPNTTKGGNIQQAENNKVFCISKAGDSSAAKKKCNEQYTKELTAAENYKIVQSTVELESLTDTGLNKLGLEMLEMSSWLLTASAGLLDATIEYSINMGGVKGLKDSVEKGWVVFRDLANMFFIFILLYIAISTILQLNDFDTKRTLAKLVVAALLINFSLFATRVVIDVPNVLAGSFYNSLTGFSAEEKPDGSYVERRSSISSQFTHQVGVIGILKDKDGKILLGAAKGEAPIFKVGLLGSVFLIILAFVFLAGAIMFIIRTIMLVFLMVLSPLAFLGAILPATTVYAKKWWHSLISNAFLAPIYLLLIWVTLETVKGLTVGNNTQETFATWLASGKTDGITIFFNFAIITGMAVAALIISKNIGGWVGSASVGLAEKGVRFVGNKTRRYGGAMAGAVGMFGYRNIVGRGADTIAEKAAEGAGQKRWLGLNRQFVNAANRVAGVGGKRSYSAVADKRKGDIESLYKSALDKAKYFNSLNEKDQTKLFSSLTAQNRAELRLSDNKLNKFMAGLTQEEQNKTKKEIRTVESGDYSGALKGLKESEIADAYRTGNKKVIDAINNISKISKGDIGKVSPEVMANVKAADAIKNTSAPIMDTYWEETKASDSELRKIAKNNISTLPEGHAIKRSIEKGIKPAHSILRNELGMKGPNDITNPAGGGKPNSTPSGGMRDKLKNVREAKRGY